MSNSKETGHLKCNFSYFGHYNSLLLNKGADLCVMSLPTLSEIYMKAEIKEYRVYQITEDYAVECYDEISADGRIFTNFYLFDGTQKFCCLRQQKEDELEEQKTVKYIFYEYYPLMRQEQDEMEELFWKKWDEKHKTENNV